MKQVHFSEIRGSLKGKNRGLVASHLRPDADAYGSTIASALWLKSEGHEVSAWNEDGMLNKYSFLPSSELVTFPSDVPVVFDAVLVLDTSVKNRLGRILDAIAGSPLWVCIDHHKSNDGYADLNLIEPSRPATAQILAEAFLESGIEITPEMATNLFAGISSDTGSFQYEGTDEKTYEVAAELIRRGVNVASLSRSLYENQPLRRLHLLRHALTNVRFSCDNRVASFSLSRSDVLAMGVLPEDNEGVIDNLRSVEGVIAAVFFEEMSGGMVRVSLRSKDNGFDACALCEHFGGGGHAMAAGARIRGSLLEVEERVVAAICEKIEKLTLNK